MCRRVEEDFARKKAFYYVEEGIALPADGRGMQSLVLW